MGGNRVRKLILALGIGAVASLAAPVWAQQAEIDRASTLMRDGKPADALALLLPLEDKYSGNVDFDYLLGISALDSGKADLATLAFERVLAVNPNFAGARLDMARAYFQLGDTTRAKTEFETVRGQNPPPAAQETISRYMEAIAEIERRRQRSIRAYVEYTLGRDNNVNNSTSQSTIAVPALGGLSFTLSPSNVRTRDTFQSIAAGGEYTREIAPGYAFFAGADLRKRTNFTQDTFDTENHDVRAGAIFGSATNQLRITGNGGRYQLDERLNRNALGLGADYRYSLSPAMQLNAFSQYSRTRFTSLGINNFNQVTSGAGATYLFGDGRGAVFGAFFWGNEIDTEGRADGPKAFTGLRLGGQWNLLETVDLFGFLSSQAGRYGRFNNTFLAMRQDDTNDAVGGVNWRFAKDWTGRGQILSTRNKSNIPLYTFNRVEVSFSVRRDFNF